MYATFLSDNLNERHHLKDLGVDGRILLEWIHVDQDRDQWRVVVNTVMNLRIQ
jgi:hypothetical protein